MKKQDIPKFREVLLSHYATHKRDLPWRDEGRTPYQIWLSEIMLQQTTVATVVDYYTRFLAQFPTVEDLANASEDDVFHLWQGLGYYSRARNLHKCAKLLVAEYGGAFPREEGELLKLPGIGPYTAAAVASMAFHVPATVVDGNVERVISRLYKTETALPAAKLELTALAKKLSDPAHPAAYSNAIMDFGATVCTPKKPLCLTCPLQPFCASSTPEVALDYPKKIAKTKKPERVGEVFVITDKNGDLLLNKRPNTGLLGGLYALPSRGWDKQDDPLPPRLGYTDAGTITHVFTHFKLTLEVCTATIAGTHPQGQGHAPDNLPPIPTLMRKVLLAAKKQP